jgi:hypothetical protein
MGSNEARRGGWPAAELARPARQRYGPARAPAPGRPSAVPSAQPPALVHGEEEREEGEIGRRRVCWSFHKWLKGETKESPLLGSNSVFGVRF